ncbi:MAG: AsmA-like C-terminal region-containing protein [candidate division WOR-3 bacterium]
MKKRIIALSIAVGALILILVGGFFYLRAIVNPTTVARAVSARASRELNRKVEIGKASLGIGLTGIGVNIDSVFIAGEREGDPPLAKVKRARLNVKILPLFWGQVSFAGIDIENPEITLISEPSKPSRKPEKEQELPFALEMGGLRVKNGSLTLLSAERETTLALSEINMSLSASVSKKTEVRLRSKGKAIGLVLAPGLVNKPLAWEVSGFYDQGGDSLSLGESRVSVDKMGAVFMLSARGLSGDSSSYTLILPAQSLDMGGLSGQVSLKGEIKIDSLRVELAKKDTSVKLAGAWGSLDASGLSVKTDAAPEPVNFYRLRLGLAGDRINLDVAASSGRTKGSLEGTVIFMPRIAYFINGQASLWFEDFLPEVSGRAEFTFRASGTPENPSVKASATLKNFRTKGLPEEIDLAEAEIIYTPDSTKLNHLSVSSSYLSLSASGIAYPIRKEGYFSVRAQRIDLDALLPKGGTGGAGDFTPDIIPRGRLEFHADWVGLRGEEIRNLQVSVLSDENGLYGEGLRASLYGGTLSGRASISHARPQLVRMDITLSGFDLSEFSKKHDPLGAKLSGRASFSVSGEFRVADPLATITLEGRVWSSGGRVQGSALMRQLADFTGIASLGSYAYSSCETGFMVKDGWVSCRRLTFSSEDVGLAFVGRASFQKELDLDLSLDVDLTKVKALSPRLSNLIIPNMQAATFYFELGGTMDSPEIKITGTDVGKQIEEEVGKELEKGKEKVMEEAEKAKKKAQEEAEKAKKKAQEEAEKQKKKAKEELEKKKKEWFK